ncbi:MAG: T9SS type A sorting domain-containing protein [Saprospiraceae bacterium]|nr:T9SS type A sorting domain-containing protein [Saprospiraceae bacterium]
MELRSTELNSKYIQISCRGEVSIEIELPEKGEAHLQIYDLHGRQIYDLEKSTYSKGQHLLSWNGKTSEGFYFPDGMYYLVLMNENNRLIQPIVRMD